AGRPGIFDRELFHSLNQGRDLYLFQLPKPIRLNGADDDWPMALSEAETFGADAVLFSYGPYDYNSLHFRHLVGHHGHYLYALFDVHDDRVVFRAKRSLRLDLADHIQIGIVDRDGQPQRYLVTTDRPGWVNGFLMHSDSKNYLPVKNEPRIQGVWVLNDHGYSVEMRIPLELIGNKLAFAIGDLDDPDDRRLTGLIGTANPGQSDEMGWLLAPSTAIEEILESLDRPHTRIRVVDINRRVRARYGSLKTEIEPEEEPAGRYNSIVNKIRNGLRPITKVFTEPFSKDFLDPASQPNALDVQGLEEGLKGKSSITSYRIADGRVEVMAAITPLTEEETVVGAVLVEMTTNSILAIKNRVIEESIGFTVLAFIIVAGGLVLFSSRLSSRIRRLRNQAAGAIDTTGRVHASVVPLTAGDEIGDLSRTLAKMLNRIEEQNSYREKMADNLEHEMRTPLAGVSASLQNLSQELADTPKNIRDYVNWALDDIKRLEELLTAIRDATSLEKALESTTAEQINLAEALTIWLESGWQKAYPQTLFNLNIIDREIWVSGDPDQLRQMMDKLIDNGNSFHLAGTPIEIELTTNDKNLGVIRVANQGPTIDQADIDNIFNSMVSLRKQSSSGPHLGLGLYIARTIAYHHNGLIFAENLTKSHPGVAVTITLPIVGPGKS
ncbi:MAG: ATP-binding protein, partial [Thermodesulfobacteriota bacterium]